MEWCYPMCQTCFATKASDHAPMHCSFLMYLCLIEVATPASDNPNTSADNKTVTFRIVTLEMSIHGLGESMVSLVADNFIQYIVSPRRKIDPIQGALLDTRMERTVTLYNPALKIRNLLLPGKTHHHLSWE